MRVHTAALGVVPPSLVNQVAPTNPTCGQIAARARQIRCGQAMKAGSGAPASTRALCTTLRKRYQNSSCHRVNPGTILTAPAGVGDLVPGALLQPWNPVGRGVGDLVPGAILQPWQPVGRGVGCAACDKASGMGDLSTVMTDLGNGEFSQAWTDLNAAATSTFGTTIGPYVVPGTLLAGALYFLASGAKKGRRR